MKRYLLTLLLFPSVALAHEDPPLCPICTCTLIQRDPEWARLHDLWWNTYHGVQFQIVEYSRCFGFLNALESILGKPITAPSRTILDYEQGIQHPVEDKPNDVEFVAVELQAAGLTLGQFYGETLACSAKIDALKVEAAARIKLKKARK